MNNWLGNRLSVKYKHTHTHSNTCMLLLDTNQFILIKSTLSGQKMSRYVMLLVQLLHF